MRSTKGRVFELRTYTANEGKLDTLDAHLPQPSSPHHITSIGYWIPSREAEYARLHRFPSQPRSHEEIRDTFHTEWRRHEGIGG